MGVEFLNKLIHAQYPSSVIKNVLHYIREALNADAPIAMLAPENASFLNAIPAPRNDSAQNGKSVPPTHKII